MSTEPAEQSSPSAPPTSAALEVDLADNSSSQAGSDTDSAYGDVASSTTSVASSIYKYRLENGRRYHAYKDGIYVIPNDDQEQMRLDLQHALFMRTFGGLLYLCPAGKKSQDGGDGKDPKRVLDIGTGTGIWAIDYADDHPEAHVLGIDLSPIQPNFVPPNVEFQIDDLEQPWNFGEKFDFIYSRMMTASFADWPRFFEQSFENLSPGGWLEVADITPAKADDASLEGTKLQEWTQQLLHGTELIGRSFNSAVEYKKQMEAAGFVNVTEKVFKWPMNTWPKDPFHKELGAWTLENISSGADGLSAAVYTRVLNWTKEELDVLLAQARKDMKNKAIHAYWPDRKSVV